jgi:Tfp pilus assembly protein PilF
MALANGGEIPDGKEICGNLVIEEYRLLAAKYPNNFEVLNALADLYCQAGRLEEADRTIASALRIAPDNGQVLDTLGWIRYQQGRFEEARESLERAAKAYPDEPIVLYHLGAAQIALGDVENGRSNVRRALDSGEDFPGAEDAKRLLGS